MFKIVKKFLLGRPLRTSRLVHERLTKVKAMAVFSSDNLSSVAYATEEILLVLVTAGAAAIAWTLPIAFAIIGLLIILTISYRQTIHAYPSGGGAYIVAKDNLGTNAGLVAGAALLIDYVLTVAVSIAAGVAAITSAFPALLEHRVAIALALILVITVANLRGVRESATMFALPTYLFIAGMLVLIALGLYKFFSGDIPPLPTQPSEVPLQGITLFLILRAFTSGLAAVTGVEAISNGVTAFQPPEARNAGITMIAMSVTLGTMFIGVSLLARFYNIVPVHGETVLSLIAKHILGRNLFYFYIQASTAMILILAANTSYADFPRLSSMLGKDGFLPRLLAMRGDRLVFSNGIITLGAAAALLIVIFQGETHRLIPLYALGVFLSFTLSQSGMVVHWFKLKTKGWLGHAVVNGIGAIVTGIAVAIIAAFKFTKGAWVVVILIPLLVTLFRTIHRHYDEVSAELDPNGSNRYKEVKPIFIIPIANINRVVINTMEYAKSLSDNILAVHVSLDHEASESLKHEWKKWDFGVELLVIPSPYRSIFGPLLRFIDRVEAKAKENERVTVLIPEFVTRKWWHYFLHNQTGLWLKALLMLRKDVVISAVPYHLHH